MDKRQRLAGVDLLRGLAIYGVVILHTDQGVRTLPINWVVLRQFVSFAVPFFLATSFYLAAGKLYAGKPYRLSARFTRLFIPYAFWTVFYLLYRSIKYLVTHQPERVRQLVHDPVSIIFFGGAAFHLYFLPLLLTGTLLMALGAFLIQKQISFKLLAVLMVGSLLVYELILDTGNAVEIRSGLAFQALLNLISPASNQNQVLRILLVEFAWVIRCLPYVLLALLLNHPAIAPRFSKWANHALLATLLTFVIINLLGDSFLPSAIQEVARGFTALLLALALSKHLQTNPIIQNLGFCCFGIYLIHLLFVETAQSVWIRLDSGYIDHVSTLTLLAVSVIVFFVSWGATALLIRHKLIAQVLV